MSDVPKERLAVGRKPFTNTGVDFFGQLLVKIQRRTHSSHYSVIFTCLTTRAIHLELANDLSTDAFILCLRRFVARRGDVEVIQCDNGSNFVGAEKELRELVSELSNNDTVNRFMSNANIKWKFNPPLIPCMGGSWESLIKSIKRSLRAVTRDHIITQDALHTFLCEVESILNHRPLTAISDDSNDFETLTPSHFLLAYPSLDLFLNSTGDKGENLRSKWKSVCGLANSFWKRWEHEYLPTLIERKKWSTHSTNLKVRDIAILPTEHTPRSHWPLCGIIDTYPGNDNVIRAVKVKTQSNEYVRPSAKVYHLELAA